MAQKRGHCIKCSHRMPIVIGGGTVTCPKCGQEQTPEEAIQKANDYKFLRNAWGEDRSLEDDKDRLRSMWYIGKFLLGMLFFWFDD